MLTLFHCKICRSKKLITVRNYHASREIDATWQHAFEAILPDRKAIGIRLVMCCNCGFLFYQDTWDDQELEKLYASENRVSKEDLSASKPGRLWELREMEGFFQRYIKNKDIQNILDIGAGDFVSLRHIASLLPEKEIHAIDPCYSESSVGKIQVFKTMLKDFTGSQNYDLVMAVHVLEHVGDLHAFFDDIRKVAKKYLYIEIPFQVSPGLFLNRSVNAQHINYFTVDTLRYLLTLHGFSVSALQFNTEGYTYNGMPGMIHVLAEYTREKKAGKSSFFKSIYYLLSPLIFLQAKLRKRK